MFRFLICSIFACCLFSTGNANELTWNQVISSRKNFQELGHRICDLEWSRDDTFGLRSINNGLWVSTNPNSNFRTVFVADRHGVHIAKESISLPA